MTSPKHARVLAVALFSLALAGTTMALPSAQDDPACDEGHECTVNSQPGECSVGGTPSNKQCYCFQVGGPDAEAEPACSDNEAEG
jgi:hypothetical protein